MANEFVVRNGLKILNVQSGSTSQQALVLNETTNVVESTTFPDVDFSAVSEDILPLFDEVYDIGSPSKKWYDGYFTNKIQIGDTASISSDIDGDLTINTNLIVQGTVSAEAGDFGNILISGSTISNLGATEYNPCLEIDSCLNVQGDLDVLGEIKINGETLESPYEYGASIGSIQPVLDNNLVNGCYSTISGGRYNIVLTNSGCYSTIGGGLCNTTDGCFSTIGGGRQNISCGSSSTVAGGDTNCALGMYSTVGGGGANIAYQPYATIGGGFQNQSCQKAVVGGGQFNSASGFYSTVAGGCLNTSVGNFSTIGGGYVNGNQGQASTIGGGFRNCATGSLVTISGGYCNCGSNTHATIGGGCCNISSGGYATVAGGRLARATGEHSTVGGGLWNTSCAGGSTVSGGYCNEASGINSIVGGGCSNIACGCNSAILGGNLNCTTFFGSRSFIGGGQSNTVCQPFSVVVGGCNNFVNGDFSGILGGGSNNTCQFSCSMIVGTNICAQGCKTTFVNNLAFYAQSSSSTFLGNPEVAGEIVYFGTFQDTTAAGQLIVFTTTGTTGWHLADADTVAESTGLLGIALGTTAGAGILLRGFARSSTYYTTTGVADTLYVSATAGGITDTAPSTTGQVVRVVGYMVDDTNDVIYFCPDNTWVQV